MLNPLIGLGLIAAVLAGLAGMYTIGRIDGTRLAERAALAEKTASLTRAIEQAAEIAAQDAEILSADAARSERIRIVYRDIKQELTRYVATYPAPVETRPDRFDQPVGSADHRPDCGLDADGLRLWTAANAGTYSARSGPGASDAALPGAAAAGGWAPDDATE